MEQKDVNFIRGILTGSLMLSTTLVFSLVLLQTKWAMVFLGLILVIIACWYLIPYLQRKQQPINWLLSIAVLNLCTIVPELGLRLLDFNYENESRIEFGYPRPSEYTYFEPDEALFWKLSSSQPNTNSLGFPGEEIVVPKPTGVYRILFLGDSVMQQGYPTFVEHFLNLKYSDESHEFESITLAIAGYSSYQGRILAEKYGRRFEPDLAVVQFGWNDHWQAYGVPDSEKTLTNSRTVYGKISDVAYQNSRILQGLNWLRVSLTGGYQVTPIEAVRVSLEQYRNNLHQINEIFRQQNIPVIFITAPTAQYRLGVPDYLVNQNFVPDKRSAVTLHKEYNQIVREMAQSNGAFVLDLERTFNSLPAKKLKAIFTRDGIHLTQFGLIVVANELVEFIGTNIPLNMRP